MPAIHVTSTATFAGKTAVCVGLGRRFISDGLRIGYIKAVTRALKLVDGQDVDEDAAFIKDSFALPESLEVITPITLTPEVEERVLRGLDATDFLQRIRVAYETISHERDIVMLEAGTSFNEGYLIGLPTPMLSDLLATRELVVARYSDYCLDDILAIQSLLGPSMLGIVINAVPRPKMHFLNTIVRPYLEGRGIAVLGILPHEQLLQSVSVRDLAEVLNGEMLCCGDAADELVENLMVGAMSVESALPYFRRKPNKAVITGGDRPDIQLAALETSTRCLVLTGNLHPSQVILERAAEVRVPIILVTHDTLTTVQIIEGSFGKTRFHQHKKIERFVQLFEQGFDFTRLYSELGIRPPAA